MNELSLFNSLFGNDGFMQGYGRGYYSPKADVLQTKDGYKLYMDLPGKTEKDVEITLKDDVLTVQSVEACEEAKDAAKAFDKENVWLLSEGVMSCGKTQFKRSFTMPKDIDCEKVKASFKNGVLCVEIGRREDAREKKIFITAA